ncbi:MAG: hypothetical protein FWE40_06650 [Oscillospiraceae bacterium]|jgi:hypothetical protein|nr:hypothetical protein [Oscillospiraceae bacterium]
MSNFRGAVIVIPTYNEVTSLRETVLALQTACDPTKVLRLWLVFPAHASQACRDEAARLAAQHFTIPIVAQLEVMDGHLAHEAQYIAAQQSDASHCLIWTADQDAPAALAAQMIEQAAQHPAAVVKLSRFLPGGSLPASKRGFINWRDATFRKLVVVLYRSKQTDPHFGLTLFPIAPFLRFDLRETFMAFTMEYVLCFERMGAQFIELPLHQQDRPEGKSNLKIKHKLRYFVPLLRLRVCRKQKIFKKGETHD